MGRINLAFSKLKTMIAVNSKPYSVDGFLTVEPYVKKLIVHWYEMSVKHNVRELLGNSNINKGLVTQIKDNDIIQLPELKDSIILDSVVIEGNDISGKETYSNFLYKDLEDKIQNKEHNFICKVEVHHLSFPVYTSYIGIAIKELLKKPRKTNFDRYLLNWLFCYDRINTIMNLFDSFNERSLFNFYHHILIFDRFYQSNWVYNGYGDNDPVVDWLLRTETTLFESVNIKDIIIFHRNRIEPDEVHDKLIRNKPGRDSNETIEFQQIIRDRLLSSKFKKKITNQYFINNPKVYYFTVKDVVVDNLPRESKFLYNIYKSLGLYHEFK